MSNRPSNWLLETQVLNPIVHYGWVGDKSNFALEYSFEGIENNLLQEKNRIWIRGKAIGNIEEKMIYPATHNTLLECISKRTQIELNPLSLTQKTNAQLARFLLRDEESRYLFSVGENFDDFICLVFYALEKEELHFLFKVVQNIERYKKQRLRNWQKEAVSIPYIETVLEHYRKIRITLYPEAQQQLSNQTT